MTRHATIALAVVGAVALALPATASSVSVSCAELPAALAGASNGSQFEVGEPACSLDDLVINPGAEISLRGAPTVLTDVNPGNGVPILRGAENGDSAFRDLTFRDSHHAVGDTTPPPVNGNGGAILLYGSSNSPLFENVTFLDNSATGLGGALAVQNFLFNGSAAGGDGDCSGAGSRDGIKLINTRFGSSAPNSGNSAGEAGGAVYLQTNHLDCATPDSVLIQDSSFTGNSATVSGGAVFFTGSPGITVRNSSFVDNSAEFEGGGLHVETDLTPGGGGALMAGSGDGGPEIASTGPLATLMGNRFELNTAGSGAGAQIEILGGAGAAALNPGALLERNVFIDNTASVESVARVAGGGLLLDSQVMTLDPMTETTDFPPIALRQVSNFFSANEAVGDTGVASVIGGGEFIQNAALSSVGDVFVGNTARAAPAVAGGGLGVASLASAPLPLTAANLTASANGAPGGTGSAIAAVKGVGGGPSYCAAGARCRTALGVRSGTLAHTPAGAGTSLLSGGADDSLFLRNSILVASPGQTAAGGFGSLDFAFSDACAGEALQGGPAAGAGNLCADPHFAAAADVHLAPTSPAVDAGSNVDVPADLSVDLDGQPRIADGNGDGGAIVDMGVDELGAIPSGGEVLHPRSLSFKLRRHLRARGRLKVRDSYSPCAGGQTVEIQRLVKQGKKGAKARKPRRWKTIRRATTKPTGRFGARLKDKLGRYRARVRRGSVVDAPTQICSGATSKKRRHRHRR